MIWKFHHSPKLVGKGKFPCAKYEFGRESPPFQSSDGHDPCPQSPAHNWSGLALKIFTTTMTMINDISLTFNIQPAVGLVLLSILYKLHNLTAPSACSHCHHHSRNDQFLQKIVTIPASSSSQVLKTRASFSPLSTLLIRPSAGKLNAVPFFSHLHFWPIFAYFWGINWNFSAERDFSIMNDQIKEFLAHGAYLNDL